MAATSCCPSIGSAGSSACSSLLALIGGAGSSTVDATSTRPSIAIRVRSRWLYPLLALQ